ncbi:hypothetical protein B0H14DRAFT_784413 [Mycena olivaceomarginata]|nr:hypothetical protein B0H14DRAFT_784413 [Mycena olivaceomarginata]
MGDRDENRGVALYHRKTAARRVSLSETRLVFGVLRRTTRFPDSDATPALSARASKFPLQQQHFRRRPQRYPVCFLLVVYAHHRFPRRSPRPRLRYDTCSHPPAWRCASTSAISPSRMRATRGLGAPTAVRLVRECRRCAMPSSASYTVSPLGGRSGRHACLHSSSRPSAADLKTPCPPHPLRGVRRRAATVWHPLPAATRCPPGVVCEARPLS